MVSRIWVDIDNPPQVQYLAPFVDAFEQHGIAVLVTARDHGIAHALLASRGIRFRGVGTHPGRSSLRKTLAVARRGIALARVVRPWRPEAALFATRSAALVSPLLRIPGFALEDYEFSDLRAYRASRTYVIHPAVLQDALLARGFDSGRLISFDGIKEDITFADIDLDSVEPHHFAALEGSTAVRVLFRPPDDRSHYHRDASSDLSRAALAHLAALDDVVVILSPRYPEHANLLEGLPWRTPPLVLSEAVPFVRLLTAVDAVVTGGGTMAREAAYLGIPSFSVFSGQLGAVDRFLEERGSLMVVKDARALEQLRPERVPPTPRLRRHPRVIDDIVESILRVVRRRVRLLSATDEVGDDAPGA